MISENYETLWRKSLNKALINNRQLEFYGYFYLSFMNQENPEIELVRFREFIDLPYNNLIISTFDKRNKTLHILKENINRILEICWFFPLSREKFKIKVRISLLNQNFYLNNSKNKLDITQQKEILKDFWEKLSKEEKKELHSKIPDTKTSENECLQDIDKFNCPEKIEISENLTLILFEPLEIDHLIFPMPQVVADARHPKFESVFQPYKLQKKYRHVLNEEKKIWDISTLNP